MELITDDRNDDTIGLLPWRSETNWIVVNGSLENTVSIESSDYPIDESDPEISTRISPLVLKPPVLDSSAPCEIKICFDQKYDVGQIYVRSTARVYEVYYAHSPHSSNEYLCTVRCGVAERDDKLLKTDCGEEVVEENGGERLVGETADESVSDRSASEDDWVTIKVPDVRSCSTSDKINTDIVENVQDLYEATAQLSDVDPCSVLTIRLLSLQEKSHVYVDEVYIFADPVESTDMGNGAVSAGSSSQSTLMAMFLPTLMQMSKSAVRHDQEKHVSDEVLKDNKMETGSTRKHETNVGLEINQVNQPYVKPKEFEKDTAVSAGPAELQQQTYAMNYVEDKAKCAEPVKISDSLPGRLEKTLEQLISRLSRVEDICLRFEEKLMKPIENIEARVQQVEHQLQRLADNCNCFGVPRCTRISAPAFVCSESNSGSFHYDPSDFPALGASELEKEDLSCNNTAEFYAPAFLCSESSSSSFHYDPSDFPALGASELEKEDLSGNNMPELSHDANFHPSLVVSAPEFPCDEDEDDNDDLEPVKESDPCEKPKKTLSVDDALAAALNGFLFTGIMQPSEHTQTTSVIFSKIGEENEYHENAEYCVIEPNKISDAEYGSGVSSQNGQVLTFKAPEFTEEEIGNLEHLNDSQAVLDMSSEIENTKQDGGDEVVPPSTQSKSLLTSTESSNINENLNTHDFESASHVDFHAAFEANTTDSYCGGDTSFNPGLIENYSKPDLDKDSYDKTNLEKPTSFSPPDENIASKQVLEHVSENDTPNISESSSASVLDFEFPILEVNFSSDVYSNFKSPLEALLGGAPVSITEASLIHDGGDDDGYTEEIKAVSMKGNEIIDPFPLNDLLVDVGVSLADGSSNWDDGSHYVFTPSGSEMKVSLI